MATPCCSFEVRARLGAARSGVLSLPHGRVRTPAFMPVGTRGSVRGIHPDTLSGAGVQMVLANTYHLWVRPGHELIRDMGGLHRFMRWSGPILTDSGGYQVFSMRDRLEVDERGATIRSPEDNQYRTLTPELAIHIQEALGVDVAMALDECIEWPASEDRCRLATSRTTRWLKRCMSARRHPGRTALFGIVQGGMVPRLRAAHAEELAALDLDGYAIGGLSVGEAPDQMRAMTALTARHLPADRPRYLMGVGHPVDLVESVIRGVDLFDCVLPTRSGRHAYAYTASGRLNLRAARYKASTEVIEPGCDCPACGGGFSRGYLRHLAKCDEMLGKSLITAHNLRFYMRLLERVRAAIEAGDEARLEALRQGAARASATA